VLRGVGLDAIAEKANGPRPGFRRFREVTEAGGHSVAGNNHAIQGHQRATRAEEQ